MSDRAEKLLFWLSWLGSDGQIYLALRSCLAYGTGASGGNQNRACGFNTESVHPIGRGSPGHVAGPREVRVSALSQTPSGLRIAFGECDALGEQPIIALAPFLGSWRP